MSDLDARLAAMSHSGNEGVCRLVLETGVKTLRGNSTDTYHASVSGYFYINPDSTATNVLVTTTSGAIWSRSRKQRHGKIIQPDVIEVHSSPPDVGLSGNILSMLQSKSSSVRYQSHTAPVHQ